MSTSAASKSNREKQLPAHSVLIDVYSSIT